MALSDDLESMYKHTKDVYDSVALLGGTNPENKNLENLAEVISNVPLKPSYDPENPTLEGLKAALDAGDYTAFPAGTEIPDTYNGQSNPLVVAQYLDSTNNSAYGGAEGVILVRKYVEPIEQIFGSSVDYTTSTIKNFLDTTYYNNCSNDLKSIISDIGVPYYNGSSTTAVTSKLFLMSDREICANYSSTARIEGEMWDYWKQKTGLSSPSNATYSGRIMKDRSGTDRNVWLRSRYNSNTVCYVTTSGAVPSFGPSYHLSVLPACFIAKDKGVKYVIRN